MSTTDDAYRAGIKDGASVPVAAGCVREAARRLRAPSLAEFPDAASEAVRRVVNAPKSGTDEEGSNAA